MINLTVVRNYIEKFSQEIETQPKENNEFAACKDVFFSWLFSLAIPSAGVLVELGAGVSPLLDFFPPEMTKITVSLGKEPGTIYGDMNTPPLPDSSADLVIARHALEHSLLPLIMLCEMARITKRYVLVIVPTCSLEMALYQNHYAVFTPVALRALFQKAGLVVVAEELNAPLYQTITEDRFLLEKR